MGKTYKIGNMHKIGLNTASILFINIKLSFTFIWTKPVVLTPHRSREVAVTIENGYFYSWTTLNQKNTAPSMFPAY